jgi:hypothetical protein
MRFRPEVTHDPTAGTMRKPTNARGPRDWSIGWRKSAIKASRTHCDESSYLRCDSRDSVRQAQYVVLTIFSPI